MRTRAPSAPPSTPAVVRAILTFLFLDTSLEAPVCLQQGRLLDVYAEATPEARHLIRRAAAIRGGMLLLPHPGPAETPSPFAARSPHQFIFRAAQKAVAAHRETIAMLGRGFPWWGCGDTARAALAEARHVLLRLRPALACAPEMAPFAAFVLFFWLDRMCSALYFGGVGPVAIADLRAPIVGLRRALGQPRGSVHGAVLWRLKELDAAFFAADNAMTPSPEIAFSPDASTAAAAAADSGMAALRLEAWHLRNICTALGKPVFQACVDRAPDFPAAFFFHRKRGYDTHVQQVYRQLLDTHVFAA